MPTADQASLDAIGRARAGHALRDRSADRRLVRGAVARRATLCTGGDEIGAGAVVGLIEAMKLFNEIKSDVAGKVTRILVERGTLVKRQQPLVEVDPR